MKGGFELALPKWHQLMQATTCCTFPLRPRETLVPCRSMIGMGSVDPRLADANPADHFKQWHETKPSIFSRSIGSGTTLARNDSLIARLVELAFRTRQAHPEVGS